VAARAQASVHETAPALAVAHPQRPVLAHEVAFLQLRLAALVCGDQEPAEVAGCTARIAVRESRPAHAVDRVAPLVHAVVAETADVAAAVGGREEVPRFAQRAVVCFQRAQSAVWMALFAEACRRIAEVVSAALRAASVALKRKQAELALSAVAGDVRASDAVTGAGNALLVCSQVQAWRVAPGALLREVVQEVARQAGETEARVRRTGFAAICTLVAVDLVSDHEAFSAGSAVVSLRSLDVVADAAGAEVLSVDAGETGGVALPAEAISCVDEVSRGVGAGVALVFIGQQVEARHARRAPRGFGAGLAVRVALDTFESSWCRRVAVRTGVEAEVVVAREVLAWWTAGALGRGRGAGLAGGVAGQAVVGVVHEPAERTRQTLVVVESQVQRSAAGAVL